MPNISFINIQNEADGIDSAICLLCKIVKSVAEEHQDIFTDAIAELIPYSSWNKVAGDMARLRGFSRVITPILESGLKHLAVSAANDGQISIAMADTIVQRGLSHA